MHEVLFLIPIFVLSSKPTFEVTLILFLAMDVGNLALLLKQTLDPNARERAEAELQNVKKIIGFCPGLLQVVMTNTVDAAVRQAGVIYFKNLVSSSWIPKEPPEPSPAAIGMISRKISETSKVSSMKNDFLILASGTVPPINPELTFSIHEQDKDMIRDNIVQATVQAPEVIRIQLAVCVSIIIKHDFPHKWPRVVDQVNIYLQTPEPGSWLGKFKDCLHFGLCITLFYDVFIYFEIILPLTFYLGALICLYQLVKNYEYKKREDRAPLNDAMNLLLPMIRKIMVELLPDQSAHMTEIKKTILKIFHALIQYILPMDLIKEDDFIKWMEILQHVVQQDIPVEANSDDIDEEDKPQLIWWKQKKWALHTLTRVFERYGSPGKKIT